MQELPMFSPNWRGIVSFLRPEEYFPQTLHRQADEEAYRGGHDYIGLEFDGDQKSM